MSWPFKAADVTVTCTHATGHPPTLRVTLAGKTYRLLGPDGAGLPDSVWLPNGRSSFSTEYATLAVC